MRERTMRAAMRAASLTVGALGCALAAHAAEPALQVVDGGVLDEIAVERVTASGAACAGGAVNVFAGRSGLQLFFTELKVARADADRSTRASTSKCAIQVKLRAVPGVTYALRGLRVLGSSYLPAGARASYRVHHAFAGAALSTNGRTEAWQGPSLGTWQHAWDDVRSTWSRCGEAAELSLEVPITVESAGLAVVEVSNLIFGIDHAACAR